MYALFFKTAVFMLYNMDVLGTSLRRKQLSEKMEFYLLSNLDSIVQGFGLDEDTSPNNLSYYSSLNHLPVTEKNFTEIHSTKCWSVLGRQTLHCLHPNRSIILLPSKGSRRLLLYYTQIR